MSVRIDYHRDRGSWWADSPDAPGFTALADTFERTRALSVEGLRRLGHSVERPQERLDGALLWSSTGLSTWVR